MTVTITRAIRRQGGENVLVEGDSVDEVQSALFDIAEADDGVNRVWTFTLPAKTPEGRTVVMGTSR